MGLPVADVMGMEDGSRTMSTLELTRVVAVLGCSEAFLMAQDYSDGNLFPVLCQVLSETGRMNRINPPEQRTLDLCHEGEVLRRFLDQPGTLALPAYRGRLTSVSMAVRQGEIAAQEERRRLGLGDNPLHDLGKVIGDQGIWAAAIDLPESLSGLFVDHAAVGTAILVNRGHAPVRQRFSCAHEYAHALFDSDSVVVATRGGDPDSLRETRASAFATAFLMPPGGVAEHLGGLGKGRPGRHTDTFFDVANDTMTRAGGRARPGSGTIALNDVALLAQHFGVGYEPMAWRLQSLGHISPGERDALLAQQETGEACLRMLGSFSGHGPDGKSPGMAEREIHTRLTWLVIEAFRRVEISRGRLMEIGKKLPVDSQDLLDLAMEARQD